MCHVCSRAPPSLPRIPPQAGFLWLCSRLISFMAVAPASAYGDLRYLLPPNYERLITSWIEEDCPSFDYGGFVVGDSDGEARLLGKSEVYIWWPSISQSVNQSIHALAFYLLEKLIIGRRGRCTLFQRSVHPTRLLRRLARQGRTTHQAHHPLRNCPRPHPQDPPGRASLAQHPRPLFRSRIQDGFPRGRLARTELDRHPGGHA